MGTEVAPTHDFRYLSNKHTPIIGAVAESFESRAEDSSNLVGRDGFSRPE